MQQTVSPQQLSGTIAAIPSKSWAHRELIAAALGARPIMPCSCAFGAAPTTLKPLAAPCGARGQNRTAPRNGRAGKGHQLRRTKHPHGNAGARLRRIGHHAALPSARRCRPQRTGRRHLYGIRAAPRQTAGAARRRTRAPRHYARLCRGFSRGAAPRAAHRQASPRRLCAFGRRIVAVSRRTPLCALRS